MNGVVLRCPNCGTTQSSGGECEACHEARVRYYCANHTPGRWLDQPKCLQCGARFGEGPRPPPAPPPAAPRPTLKPPPVTVTVPEPERTDRRPRRKAGVPIWGRRKRWRRPEEEFEWHEEREERADEHSEPIFRTTRTPWGATDEPEPVELEPVHLVLGGCLRFALAIALFLLLGSLGLSLLLSGAMIELIGW